MDVDLLADERLTAERGAVDVLAVQILAVDVFIFVVSEHLLDIAEGIQAVPDNAQWGR